MCRSFGSVYNKYSKMAIKELKNNSEKDFFLLRESSLDLDFCSVRSSIVVRGVVLV